MSLAEMVGALSCGVLVRVAQPGQEDPLEYQD